VLPTSRLFGRISQKGPNKKWRGQTNLRQILNEKGQQGAELKKFFSLLLSSLILGLILGKFKKYYYSHRQKIVIFLSPNSFKKWPNFSSWTGRKVLQRVGNTALCTWCRGGTPPCRRGWRETGGRTTPPAHSPSPPGSPPAPPSAPSLAPGSPPG
jgi:hypothetical protein